MAQAGAAGGVLKDSGRTTGSGRRVRTSPQLQVAARCASLAPAWAERQVTRPGSAAGPAGGTRKAGVGTARRGPPLHPRGLRGRVGAFGAGRGRCSGAGGSPRQRADRRRSPLPPEPATQSGQIALWRTQGSRGPGVGCSSMCSRAESLGRKVSPSLTAGGCQAPHLLAPVLGTRAHSTAPRELAQRDDQGICEWRYCEEAAPC